MKYYALLLLIFLVACAKPIDLNTVADDMKAVDSKYGVAPASVPFPDSIESMINELTALRNDLKPDTDAYNLLSFRINQLKASKEFAESSFPLDETVCDRLENYKFTKQHSINAVSYSRKSVSYLDKLNTKAEIYVPDVNAVKRDLTRSADNLEQSILNIDNYIQSNCK